MDEALSLFRSFGLLPVGFQPVCRERNKLTVIEWDCVLAPHETAKQPSIPCGSVQENASSTAA